MFITKELVRDQLLAYLNHEITLAQLVDWAEEAVRKGELDVQDAEVLRDVVARLNLADVRQFGLRWEDYCEFLTRLGYQVQVKTFPVSSSSVSDQAEPIAGIGQLLKGGLTSRAVKVGGLIGLIAVVVIGAMWFIISVSRGDNRLTASIRRLSPPTPTPTPTATRPPEATRVPTATLVPTPTPRFFEPHILVGCTGIARGCFDSAQSIGVDGKGNIYVGDDSDFIGGRVQVFDPTGEFISQWLIGDKDTDLDRIAVDRQGIVYVVSDGDIHRYEGASGKRLGQVEYSGGQGFQDVAVTADGKLVASWNKDWQGGLFIDFDESQDDIVVFDSAGRVVNVLKKALSEIAGGEAELDTWITVDKQGNMYATGMLNPGIYKFAPNGKFVGKFGAGQVEDATSLAVDAQGRMVVSCHSDIRIFAPDGRYIGMEDWSANDMVFNDQNELLTIDGSQVMKFVLNR